jgi:hypothetical protein
VRFSEKNFPQGFAWKMPEHQFVCGTVTQDDSLITGYKQFFVDTANADCTETFTMERADWWSTDPLSIVITVKVGAGSAPEPPACTGDRTLNSVTGLCECPFGTTYIEAQDKCEASTSECTDGLFFDGFNCVAELPTAPAVTPVPVDSMHVRIPLDFQQVLTIQEPVQTPTTGFYWNWDLSGITCLYKIAESETEGFRTATFVATTPNCRWNLVRTATDSAESATQTIEFIVWPDSEPATQGELIDVDTATQTEWEVAQGA